MRSRLWTLAFVTVILAGTSYSGINWKAVWLEPRIPVSLTVGETLPYKVTGLDGADHEHDLTKSKYLKITSSDPDIVEVDQQKAVLIGKKPGQVELRISFSEATSITQASVRERKPD